MKHVFLQDVHPACFEIISSFSPSPRMKRNRSSYQIVCNFRVNCELFSQLDNIMNLEKSGKERKRELLKFPSYVSSFRLYRVTDRALTIKSSENTLLRESFERTQSRDNRGADRRQ